MNKISKRIDWIDVTKMFGLFLVTLARKPPIQRKGA